MFSRSGNKHEKAKYVTINKGYLKNCHAETFMHIERNHTDVLNCNSSYLQFKHLYTEN